MSQPQNVRAGRPKVVRVGGAETDVAALATDAETARTTHVRIHDLHANLAPLASHPALVWLELNDPRSLDGLGSLTRLETLVVYHFPRVHALDEIGALANLRRLHLSTPPGYDASRKVHHVQTLAPLARLTRLESLVMRGVLPAADRLEPLHRLTALTQLEVSHVFAFDVGEYARLARDLPGAHGHCLVPYFEDHWTGRCRKCGRQRVALTAPPPRSPRLLCPEHNRDRLERHLAAWRAAQAR